ncbi:phytanoyl-CoA dioxygenase family protein [Paenibacillus sp. IB182496]|uniref:Phytanoyl-CoA dioxygenase family protein n=1 Tax=Paenibacillus sabuli TaxID=2772509 RepID=A0A927BQL0_9BACL|nr:phytanoyl-CoA dioxygenase family protein [Paenibacillus sabuli]MBD2843744.1 phytanoyl-CoA dioxygenase family protein [Paenibacillus sabuli]
METIKGMVHRVADGTVRIQSDRREWHQVPQEGEAANLLPGQRVVLTVEAGNVVRIGAETGAASTPCEIADSMYRYDQVETERVPTADAVGEAQLRRFAEQGYLVVDQLLSPQEVADALADVDAIIQGRIQGPRVQFMRNAGELRTPEARELAVRKLSKYVEHAPALRAVCEQAGLRGVLAGIFGEPASLIEDQAILKPPGGEAGAEKPWHQDMAYGTLSQTKPVCGVWIALDEATLDNGCMHVIPGSHAEGPVPHFAVRDWQLCDAHVRVERDVAVPLQPGGALFFSGLLHHGTPPNFSDRRRRALQFHFSPQSSQRMTPQQFKAMFTSELNGAEC